MADDGARRALLAEMVSVYGGYTGSEKQRARLLLMRWKLGTRRIMSADDSLLRARLAANFVKQTGELDFAAPLILSALELNDKQFFIDFANVLRGKIKLDWFDKHELAIAELIVRNPQIRTKDALRELRAQGVTISEDNFRMWKMRLRKLWLRIEARLSQPLKL